MSDRKSDNLKERFLDYTVKHPAKVLGIILGAVLLIAAYVLFQAPQPHHRELGGRGREGDGDADVLLFGNKF
ncbi:MAG: hypothetical protein LBP95_10065 [Deltaproteobacteria bacterium]|jgi:hypothetical protein|nr:hypothetical protein [Deltaproteobacteria bacterium]